MKTVPRSHVRLFAAIAAGLLVTMWASPSTATEVTPCQRLGAAMFSHGWSGAQNPMKPVNVGGNAEGSIDVYWDVPSTRPDGTVSGWCVHLQHAGTGGQKEWCDSNTATEAHIGDYSCLSYANCPLGDYSVKVKMKNNCGLTEDWSDSINFNRTENRSGDGAT